MKINKMMQYRNDGMVRALEIAEKSGVEGLRNEIRNRNINFMPLEVSREKLEDYYRFFSERIFKTYSCTVMYTLHEEFGFGGKRLNKFKDAIDEVASCLNTYDRFGERYLHFQDIAKELNEKYHIEVDQAVMETVDNANDRDQVVDRKVSLEAVRELLEKNGFKDAVKFLEEWEVKYYAS